MASTASKIVPREEWLQMSEVEGREAVDGEIRRIRVPLEGQLRPLRFPETIVDAASVRPD